ncbi:1,4-alpha-glucan branching protein GlgB [Paenibacillus sp. JX-17]|uniref:1,4-alpha-glucan branching enzyme GlgB n=1 Tax=Paenibacillus lacisoli TaxID=3064525 RepID=A0ABT9CB93_9BACL|nr:1,4-alpha-glucan branching protein GlgB [Paenibacillus sp. JX-17]MDO7904888.1 1,4-alpha-glucan branching protein GlgB [Paenibacillus sp. JX-17]
MSKEDIYLFHEGTLYQSYRSLGAHLTTEDGEEGVRFTVWAPNALHVGLAADFNGWNGENDSLHKIPDSGIWSRFFPGITEGTFYKYDITSPSGERLLKADPYAIHAEVRPATASVVSTLEGHSWKDAAWVRKQREPYQKPLNIYEVHFGTWKQKEDGSFYTYREMAELLIPYVLEMGYTHIEIMPLSEHPYDLSWGYQSTGLFALTSRYGKPQDFMYFVDQCHQAGIGVLLDWVPAHFAKDAQGLRQFDGAPLYEYGDPLLAEKPGWGTLSFDYSKPEIRSYLISNALFWMEVYHIDGLRVDAVTSMIRLDFEKQEGQFRRNVHGGLENLEAIQFLQQLNRTIFSYYPHALMMAEESSAWPKVTSPIEEDGLGFNYKWNMGWMNDTLDYVEKEFQDRPNHHNLLTFPIVYAYSENFILPLSHDEVVHGKKSLLDKMPGSYEQKFAGLRALLGYQITSPGKKLLFMGGEFGQFIEWKDEEPLDWFLLDYDAHRQVHHYTKMLNHLYKQEKALWELDHSMDGYQWISADDSNQSVISYIRHGKKPGDSLIILINLQPVERPDYRIGLYKPGSYDEIFNSDSVEFGGNGSSNGKSLKTTKISWHGQPNTLEVKLPPLSMVILKKTPRKTAAKASKADEKVEIAEVQLTVKKRTKKAKNKPLEPATNVTAETTTAETTRSGVRNRRTKK